jgi:hypothetical protein
MFSKHLYVDVDDKTRAAYIQRQGSEQFLDEILDKINSHVRMLVQSMAGRDMRPVMPEPFIIGTK